MISRPYAFQRLLRMHHESGVGHLGGNLSALDTLLVLHQRIMSGDDQFILSKGHSAGALYVALWSVGKLDENDLASFHADNTLLAGHPPAKGVADIALATGSLGHGLSLAAGCALSAKFRGSAQRVFCLTSDGDWQEGATWEAAMFAAHHGLSQLTILLDANGLQGFGTTEEIASAEPLERRFAAFDLDVEEIDGHDPDAIERAMTGRGTTGPRLIILRTCTGFTVPSFENQVRSHYLPLSDEDFAAAMSNAKDLS